MATLYLMKHSCHNTTPYEAQLSWQHYRAEAVAKLHGMKLSCHDQPKHTCHGNTTQMKRQHYTG